MSVWMPTLPNWAYAHQADSSKLSMPARVAGVYNEYWLLSFAVVTVRKWNAFDSVSMH